jgi:hypothetical protein
MWLRLALRRKRVTSRVGVDLGGRRVLLPSCPKNPKKRKARPENQST